MTLTACPCADPCFAFASNPDSSGAMREVKVPVLLVLFPRCPKAIPVARSKTRLRRLHQAGLRRSSQSVFSRLRVRIIGNLSRQAKGLKFALTEGFARREPIELR